MKKRLIKIGSITYAMKTKKILSSIGVRVRVIKTSSDSNGCAYSIEIQEEQLYTVIAELKRLGIDYELSSKVLP